MSTASINSREKLEPARKLKTTNNRGVIPVVLLHADYLEQRPQRKPSAEVMTN